MNAMTNVWLSLGSNFPAAPEILEKAACAIGLLPHLRILGRSPVYLTEPQEMRDQPWFHNQALKLGLEKYWRPETLLAELLELEKKLGRVRDKSAPRFGPRAIDIDLLLFGDERSADPFCVLPHPRLTRRAFALVPLRDIDPDLIIGDHSVRFWLEQLDWRLEGKKIFQECCR